MFKVMKACAPWLNWQVVGIAMAVIVGLIVCTGIPSLSILAGATPLLLLVACLAPCLLPLAFVRRKNRTPIVQLSKQPANSTTCGCGQNSYSVGPGANSCKRSHTPKSARS